MTTLPDRPAKGIFACLLLVTALLGGCGDKIPQIHLPGDAVFLAFGDSLTYGTGAGKQESYPAILAHLSGHTVINAGIPGEISAQGKERLPGLLDRYKPGLLILCHGGNDMLRRLSPDAMKSNLEAMIDSAAKRNIPVLLIGVPSFAVLFPKANGIYDEIAEKYALLYEGEVLPRIESEAGLKSDRVHPNAEGYRQIAMAVQHLLQDSGALD